MQSFLATGLLKKLSGSQSRPLNYIITCLEERHLPLVMEIQEAIARNLERSDLLQTFSEHFMKQHMGRHGVAIGVFIENRLAAFRNVYYPHPLDHEWNLGIDLNLDGAELSQVANFQMVCVHPRFRGNALALKMNRISLRLLRENGTHPHVCATVSPHNIWNIPILLTSGFVIAGLKTKYGGKLRYIVYQNLDRWFTFHENSAKHVRLDDFKNQRKLFADNFFGVAIRQNRRIDRKNPIGCFDLVFKCCGNH